MLEEVATVPALVIARPQSGEYAPYYERYISLIEDLPSIKDSDKYSTP